jgi:LCP family protein required for cell wall assembly
LLLGADARPWSSNFRTDTIILLTLNSELGRVNLTSFPRDLYITVPGYGLQRINTAYTYGKYPLLAKTFEYNFGVRPDHYVLLNFKAFKQIIDSLDGLDVNVGQPLSDYRAGYWVTIPAGTVHMDADTILWYVRSRKTTNDFARNRRQQEVLQALFDKLLSLNALRRVPEFYDFYDDNVTMDITLLDLLTWLPLAASVAESGNIHHYYVNSKQVYDWITPGGAMVLLPDKKAIMQTIRKSQNLR